ncbi:hypothetical protein PLICRDRAFT_377921 [Plicaturopsis crispa FD-325 SS-3]|nr:hypothetical protein PLICRDRAFT_377921 [Plicaturopsis crispa FD-325 SS-3]
MGTTRRTTGKQCQPCGLQRTTSRRIQELLFSAQTTALGRNRPPITRTLCSKCTALFIVPYILDLLLGMRIAQSLRLVFLLS